MLTKTNIFKVTHIFVTVGPRGFEAVKYCTYGAYTYISTYIYIYIWSLYLYIYLYIYIHTVLLGALFADS